MAGWSLAMLGLAFASVPLYRLFCEATGIGGTPQRAERAPGAVAGKSGCASMPMSIGACRGGSSPTSGPCGSRRAPAPRSLISRQTSPPGPTTGTASVQRQPDQAGQYFNKIECFCFTEQTLKGGEKVDMPVVFFVDPGIVDDPDAGHIDEITLSYTFYPVESAAAAR